MQIWQGNLIEALRGIQAFLDQYAGVLGTIPGSGARKKLDAQVAELMARSAAQDSSRIASLNATQLQYERRVVVLRDHMTPIARIAAAEVEPGPDIHALTMPARGASTQQLYAAAMGMAEAAEPYAAMFVNAGLADDFIAQLRGAANDLLAPVDSRTLSRGVRKGATATMMVLSSRVRKTVRVLDALIQRELQDDTDLLAQWKSVKRPAAKAGKSRRATTATPRPEASAPLPSAATAPPPSEVYAPTAADTAPRLELVQSPPNAAIAGSSSRSRLLSFLPMRRALVAARN